MQEESQDQKNKVDQAIEQPVRSKTKICRYLCISLGLALLILIAGGLWWFQPLQRSKSIQYQLDQLKQQQKQLQQDRQAQYQQLTELKKQLLVQRVRQLTPVTQQYWLLLHVRDLVQQAYDALHQQARKRAVYNLMWAEKLLATQMLGDTTIHTAIEHALADLHDIKMLDYGQILLQLNQDQDKFITAVQTHQLPLPLLLDQSSNLEKSLDQKKIDRSEVWWKRILGQLQGYWKGLLHQFSKMWVITKVPEMQDIVMLYPHYWQVHGRLYFEQAIWAVLHHQPILYKSSIKELVQKVKATIAYYPKLQDLLPELLALQKVELDKKTPDLLPLLRLIDEQLQRVTQQLVNVQSTKKLEQHKLDKEVVSSDQTTDDTPSKDKLPSRERQSDQPKVIQKRFV